MKVVLQLNFLYEWRTLTYKALEPGPYWPDTGQAHMTCKALLVTFMAREDWEKLVAASRLTRVFSSGVKERTGMTSRLSLEKIVLG